MINIEELGSKKIKTNEEIDEKYINLQIQIIDTGLGIS